ncbi:MAG: NAD(+) synthase [Epulopiscium sp.]|nr:NAD(+) synthase [Candidatus Epulonipiscium sp.]
MNFGYIRVGAAIPKGIVGDCVHNVDQIIYWIDQAKKKNIQILAFPELSVTSATCGDLFHQELLLVESQQQLTRILDYTREINMLIVIGIPLSIQNQIFNCGILLHQGKILGVVPKTFLSISPASLDQRWFSSSSSTSVREIKICEQNVPFGTNLLFQDQTYPELCIGIEIGEDLYAPIPPSSFLCLQGATLIVHLNALPTSIGSTAYYQSLVQQQSGRCISGYLSVSAGEGESTTDQVFRGASFIAENNLDLQNSCSSSLTPLIYGDIDYKKLVQERQKNRSFGECLEKYSIITEPIKKIPFNLSLKQIAKLSPPPSTHPFIPKDEELDQRCIEIFNIQCAGLMKRLEHTQTSKVVLGISGGLDSTLALLTVVKTFDKMKITRNNILGITMPGFGTTGRTYENAIRLMDYLNITQIEIPIREATSLHFKDIGHNPEVHDITYENSQARERTQILMDLANKEQALVIGTGNLSELALGWATYNGDHMSMYAINASIPKTLVQILVRWAALQSTDVGLQTTLLDIVNTPISPELLPPTAGGKIEQKTEEVVGPYELHDFYMYAIVRFNFSPSKVFYLAQQAFSTKYDSAAILYWMKVFYRRFFSQQFKRSCLPDNPAIGSVSLSPRGAWSMPSDASVRIWMDEIEKLEQII